MSKQERCQVCQYAKYRVANREFWRGAWSWACGGLISLAAVFFFLGLILKSDTLIWGFAAAMLVSATGFSIAYLIVAMKTLRVIRTLDDKSTEHAHLFVEQSWPHLMWQTERGPQPVRAGETNGFILLENLHGWGHPLEFWRVYQDALVDRRAHGFRVYRMGELTYELIPRALSGDQGYVLRLLGRFQGDIWKELDRLGAQLDALKKERDDARECIGVLGRGYFRVLLDLEGARPTLGRCKHYFALTKFIRDRVDETQVPAQEVDHWEREVREEYRSATPSPAPPNPAAAVPVLPDAAASQT